jgi:hypothetical protein
MQESRRSRSNISEVLIPLPVPLAEKEQIKKIFFKVPRNPFTTVSQIL